MTAHSRPLVPQVDAHQLGSDRRDEPDQRRRSDEVGHGVGDRDIVDERRLVGLGNRQALNRVSGRADHRRFREGAGQQPCGRADVIAEKLRESESDEQARDTEHDRQRHLRKRVRLQAAEKLWADLVSRGEEKEIEKHRLDERRNLDVELPDQHSRQKTADDDAEREAAEPHAADQKADRNREEDGELGVQTERGNDVVHGSSLRTGAEKAGDPQAGCSHTGSRRNGLTEQPPGFASLSPRSGRGEPRRGTSVAVEGSCVLDPTGLRFVAKHGSIDQAGAPEVAGSCVTRSSGCGDKIA